MDKRLYNLEHAMRKILFYCLIAFSCVAPFGCAQNQLLFGNKDESISLIKNYQDALEPDFKFLGKVKGAEKAEWSSIARGASLESESLLYGHMRNNKVIEKGMIVRTYKVRGASDALLNDLFTENKNILSSGNLQIAGRKFIYDVLTKQDIFDRNEKKLIDGKGLVIVDCYVVKEYSGDLGSFFDKSKSHILYFEAINVDHAGIECKQLTAANTLGEKENSLLIEFNQTADKTVNKLLGGETVDKSSADKPDLGKSDVEVPVAGATEIERKLSTLKNLLDAGLITQSDYDRKKAELLDKF